MGCNAWRGCISAEVSSLPCHKQGKGLLFHSRADRQPETTVDAVQRVDVAREEVQVPTVVRAVRAGYPIEPDRRNADQRAGAVVAPAGSREEHSRAALISLTVEQPTVIKTAVDIKRRGNTCITTRSGEI